MKTASEISPRDQIKEVLRGKLPAQIPILQETPMDVTVRKIMDTIMPPVTGNEMTNIENYHRFLGNTSICQGITLMQDTLSRDKGHHRYRYETGAIWREDYDVTFCREAESFPINSPDDIASFRMPIVDIPERIDRKALSNKIQSLKDAGFFVQGTVMGSWAGIYYYLTSFENILMWMASEPELAHSLFKMTKDFSIDSARILLECGVDCIYTASDLGSGSALLFSREMVKEYVYPWLKDLADLCHKNNSFLHLHSHGYIQDIMDYIVEAGVDIINPIGPSDHNDLEMFKNKWGDKICLHGGISTTIAQMTESEIADHVKTVINTGKKGGRFFPRTESGIPYMPPEKIKFYIDTLKHECSKGYE